MHILILNWRDITHPLAGGAEISLLEHVKYWQKQGAKIVWIASMYPHAKKIQIIDGIKIIRFGSAYTVHFWVFIESIKGNLKNFDIIIDSFHFIPYFFILYTSKKKKVIGLINEVAGKLWFSNLFFPFALIGFFLEPFFLRLYKNSIFITGSDSAKNELVSHGINKKSIEVINHGFHAVKIAKHVKKEKYPVLIFVGRISKDKGIEDVFKIFMHVKNEKKNCQLWLVGKEEKKGIVKSLIREYTIEIKKGIHYFGFVTEKDKYTLLRKAWILVHASEKEGWGLNVIEANSMGTPAIGYNVPGLHDSIQDGKTGLLAPRNTPRALAEQIVLLLNDTNLYNDLAKNAQVWSKKFSWKTAGKKSWNIIQKVQAYA